MLYEFIGVTLEHPAAGVTVARDFDLQVVDGEFLVLTGPSGSGKTTVLNAIAGFQRPTSGRVVYRGRNLAALSPAESAECRNRDIAMVHQSFNLLTDLDAMRNVMVPLLIRGVDTATARRAALDMLDRLGVAHRATHRPAQMSGGEQQRVAIGRALVTKPHVLLADEPTGNLDSASTDEFLGLLGELHRSGALTVVLVTHDSVVAAAGTRRIDLTGQAGWVHAPGV